MVAVEIALDINEIGLGSNPGWTDHSSGGMKNLAANDSEVLVVSPRQHVARLTVLIPGGKWE